MKIRIGKDIAIICNIETSFMCGNAYHNVEIYQHNVLMFKEHIHCCENGYEAILYLLNKLPESDHKEQMIEVVSNEYLLNC